jgi:hypothetical protein
MLQEKVFDQDATAIRETRPDNESAVVPKVWTMHR